MSVSESLGDLDGGEEVEERRRFLESIVLESVGGNEKDRGGEAQKIIHKGNPVQFERQNLFFSLSDCEQAIQLKAFPFS
jgi:hypothetical protein